MPPFMTIGKIKIDIYYNDTQKHKRPHYHINCQEGRISVAIDDNTILAGNVPERKIKVALKWAKENQETLIKTWNERNPQAPIEE